MALSAMAYLPVARSHIAGQADLWLIFLFICHLLYPFFSPPAPHPPPLVCFMPLTLVRWFPRKISAQARLRSEL